MRRFKLYTLFLLNLPNLVTLNISLLPVILHMLSSECIALEIRKTCCAPIYSWFRQSVSTICSGASCRPSCCVHHQEHCLLGKICVSQEYYQFKGLKLYVEYIMLVEDMYKQLLAGSYCRSLLWLRTVLAWRWRRRPISHNDSCWLDYWTNVYRTKNNK